MTTQPPTDAARDGSELGHVLCHCSEDDGVPDVGVSVGFGNGCALWIGELLTRDGGDIGIVFHGPDGQRIAAPMWPSCEWQEAADILRHHVGPALSRRATRQQPEAGSEAVLWAAIDQNDAMRQELAHVGNLVSDLARAMHVEQANDDGTWPDLAGCVQKLIAATRLAGPAGVGREEVASEPLQFSQRLRRLVQGVADNCGLDWSREAKALLSHAEAGGVEGWRTMTPDEAREMLEYDADTIINCMTEWGFVASPAAVAGGGA